MLRPIATAQPGCGWRRSMPLSMPIVADPAHPHQRVADLRRQAHLAGDVLAQRSLPRLAADEDQPVDRLAREGRLVVPAAEVQLLDEPGQRLAARLLDAARLIRATAADRSPAAAPHGGSSRRSAVGVAIAAAASLPARRSARQAGRRAAAKLLSIDCVAGRRAAAAAPRGFAGAAPARVRGLRRRTA